MPPAAPSYSSLAYWETRFSLPDARENHGSGFEWLTRGTILIDLVAQHHRAFHSLVGPTPPDGSDDPDRHAAASLRQPTTIPPPCPHGVAAVASVPRPAPAQPNRSTPPFRILHIGIGSSTLSAALYDRLQPFCTGPNGVEVQVTNVDFSPAAVASARQSDGGRGMRYRVVDLLHWPSVRSLLPPSPSPSPSTSPAPVDRCETGFHAIVDKSTTDSVATAPDFLFILPAHPVVARPDRRARIVRVEETEEVKTFYLYQDDPAPGTDEAEAEHGRDEEVCPSVLWLLLHQPAQPSQQDRPTSEHGPVRTLRISPVHLLSLHLAAVSSRSATDELAARWFVLSYSETRWRDVRPLCSFPSEVVSGLSDGVGPGQAGHYRPEANVREAEGISTEAVAGWPWRVLERRAVEVSEETSLAATTTSRDKDVVRPPVFTPAVFHSAYVLQCNGT